MITTDTVTDCTTNDLSTTTTATSSTQTTYDGTTPIKFELVKYGIIKPKNDDKKQSKLIKEACIALGLPIDTTGGKKPSSDNVAIFEWLRDNKTTSAELTDLPTVEPVAPAEEIVEAIEPKTTTDLFALETENVNMPIGINEIPALPKLTAIEARQKVNNVKSCLSIARSELLDLRDRDGWRALGYESWEEFGATEFDYSVQYLNRITTADSIQKSLETIVSEGEIKETHLRPLTSIPENERAAIWEEANRKAEELGKERTAKMVQDAVNEWKAKHDAVQNDLLAVRQQNDDLRGNIDAKVSAVIATERADLVVESSSAMQALQKQLSDAQDKIAQQKNDYDKDVKDGVARGLGAKECEISQLEYKKERITNEIEKLLEVERCLDKQVGTVAIHKESIKNIKENLTFIAAHFDESAYTREIPVEVTTDWQQIRTAIKKLDAEMDDFFDNHAAIDGAVLVGEVVTL
jgi:hypothetical protein